MKYIQNMNTGTKNKTIVGTKIIAIVNFKKKKNKCSKRKQEFIKKLIAMFSF